MQVKRRRRHGLIAIWTMLVMIVLIGFVGLAIDSSYTSWVGQKLQIASDAASLAGARHVRTDANSSRQAAQDIAKANSAGGKPVSLDLNDGNDPSGDIVLGIFNMRTQQFQPSLTNPNAVKVVSRRTKICQDGAVQLFFGPVFGVHSVDVSRSAIAMLGGGTGYGMIVLNNSAPSALRISGGLLDVGNGPIHVNSSSSTAVDASGSATIQTTELGANGNVSFSGGSQNRGQVVTGRAQVDDPLAYLPAPTWTPASDHGTVTVSGKAATINPGYYSGGITVTGGGSLTLNPGIYILDGVGLDVSASTLIAKGVMIYVVDSNLKDGVKSRVNLSGSSNVVLTPPDPSVNTFPGADTYAGLGIFQARGNTNASVISGSAGMRLSGTIYFPSAKATISGNATSVGDQLILDTVELSGGATVHIQYTGNFPAGGNKVFLVQ